MRKYTAILKKLLIDFDKYLRLNIGLLAGLAAFILLLISLVAHYMWKPKLMFLTERFGVILGVGSIINWTLYALLEFLGYDPNDDSVDDDFGPY